MWGGGTQYHVSSFPPILSLVCSNDFLCINILHLINLMMLRSLPQGDQQRDSDPKLAATSMVTINHTHRCVSLHVVPAVVITCTVMETITSGCNIHL